ncbi:MAG: hybrid sensor histidine kinase/response regulator [Solirubrobacterales bacterium]
MPLGHIDDRKVTLINTALTVVVFLLDCMLPDGVSGNILYIATIMTAAYSPVPNAPYRWAAVSTVASLAASVFAPAGVGIVWEAADRAMTIASLWLVAAVVCRLREARGEAETERRRAVEAMEAKGRFLSAASHDLRQPVQSLMLFVAALEGKLKDNPTQGIVASMARATEALKTLLDNVLDISKLDAGVLQPKTEEFAVGPLLARVAEEYGLQTEAKGLRLHHVPCRLWSRSDPALVERILRNLVDNAVRYTEAGGILIGCRHAAGRLRIEVVDTGRGIPEDQIERIFDEFHQVGNPERSRQHGHGLGLAIVKRTAELLGLQLTVASVIGQGTRFSLDLPSIPAPPAQPSDPQTIETVPADMAVLVVEDDPLVLPAIKMVLENLGCSVEATASRSDALVAARLHPPALIISDFRLPGDCDGIQIISDIRSLLGADVPASVLTGDLNPAIEARSRRLGMGLLRKPVRQDDLAFLVAGVRKAS